MKSAMRKWIRFSFIMIGIVLLLFSAFAVPPREQTVDLAATSTPGMTPAIAPALQPIPCSNAQYCREIDEVWQRKVGPLVGNPAIWDTASHSWKKFEEVHLPAPSPVPTPPAQPQPSAPLPALCFPVEQNSFNTTRPNFGSPREDGNRCHAGIDILTKGEGRVVAIADGEIVGIQPTFIDPGVGRCGNKAAAALLIYHSGIENGVTINYGEMNPDSITNFQVGTRVTKGQHLGKATHCGMLHLEKYQGQVYRTTAWNEDLPAEVIRSNQCAEEQQFLAVKPRELLNPTDFINSIKGEYCSAFSGQVASGSQVIAQPTAPSSPVAQPAASSSTVAQQWEQALTTNGLTGRSWVGKLSSNGAADNFHRSDTGRNTIIFAPTTTDFSRPLELIYFFHGLHGFTEDDDPWDMSQRVAPQAKEMSQQGRNIVIVFPELPWSRGQGNDERWARDRSAPIWNEQDSNLVQFHTDIINTIRSQFSSSAQIGFVTMVGHSRGGAALSYAAEHPTTGKKYLSQLNPLVNLIIFSDAGYDFGSRDSYQAVYNNYIKSTINSQMALLVQHPSTGNAHEPTTNAIDFLKQVWPTARGWTYTTKINSNVIETASTPGAEEAGIYRVSDKIWYVPLNKQHKTIGKLSLHWQPPSSTAT